MSENLILVVLNIALTGFTALLAWFLKELWGLWKEANVQREKLREHLYVLERSMVENVGLMRDMISELRLELAKDYVASEDFKDFKEKYTRPSIHDLRERVSNIERQKP